MAVRKIIATTGLPGSGKALFSEVAVEYGCPIFVCGDIVREETRKRGMPLTPSNMGAVMLKIREEEGPAVISKRLVPKINASQCDTVVVEGTRSLEEVEELRKCYGNVTVVAIHASPQIRFERLKARGRQDDPVTWQEFETRDYRELNVGLGKTIALADKAIVNEDTIEEFLEDARAFLEEILPCE